jgi:hypothetical protein
MQGLGGRCLTGWNWPWEWWAMGLGTVQRNRRRVDRNCRAECAGRWLPVD